MEQSQWTPEVLAWNGGAVVRIAQQIRQNKDWASLPILADALEEAGSLDVTTLRHLRQSMHHANGCWVLDEILQAAVKPKSDSLA